jgi:hypothetical protein
MSVLIKGMKMPENGNETIIRIQPNGTILDQYGHHLIIKAVHVDDVVEVVRCRDCVFWDTSWDPGVGMKGGAYYCPRCHLVTLKDSFCSGACRKDGGQDNGTA